MVNPLLADVPPGVVNRRSPDLPNPTIPIILSSETTVKEAAGIPPKLSALTPVKFLPIMVILVPSTATAGEKELIAGSGMNVNPLFNEVPASLITDTSPVVPASTRAIMVSGDTTVNEAAGVPPKLTELVPAKFVPVMVILVPATATAGSNELIIGG
jgi:hypothetical protein